MLFKKPMSKLKKLILYWITKIKLLLPCSKLECSWILNTFYISSYFFMPKYLVSPGSSGSSLLVKHSNCTKKINWSCQLEAAMKKSSRWLKIIFSNVFRLLSSIHTFHSFLLLHNNALGWVLFIKCQSITYKNID